MHIHIGTTKHVRAPSNGFFFPKDLFTPIHTRHIYLVYERVEKMPRVNVRVPMRYDVEVTDAILPGNYMTSS